METLYFLPIVMVIYTAGIVIYTNKVYSKDI